MEFYGHTGYQPDKCDWQKLADHLSAVGDLAALHARYFGGEDCARISGLLHDVGKYTLEFQARLEGDPRKVDHATRGAILALSRYGAMGRLLAYGIAGHHAGLANGRDAGVRTSLKDRLCKELPALLEQWEKEVDLPNAPSQPKITPEQSRVGFQYAFLGRMLFSCLVDADFLDTEAFYCKLDNSRPPRDRIFPTLAALRERLNEYLSRFQADSSVNEIRAEILEGVRARAVEPPGLFSLNVPTGGGKTLTSLAFALDHAIQHGLRRIIFVIPFTSIVEQNAAVFRKAFGKLGDDAVLEHHSAFNDDKTESPQARDKLKRAMENWDAPVVVTTAVQFFESLFADRPSQCRKLHNITGSVVILDEAQTLPLKLLRPCMAAMDELAKNYQTSMVLCTATQPALSKEDGFERGLVGVRELAPNPKALHRMLERVRVEHVGVLEDEAVTDELNRNAQILCIVNNRRHARSLFDSIEAQPGARHLTTLMCAKHRSEVLADIRQDLILGRPCRLVATSLIEAGVDVDFPTVLRAEAGLDSIAQAAGRCNREGKRKPEESWVKVFAVGGDWPTPPELEQFAQAARSAFRRHPDDVLSLQAIQEYFSELYWVKGIKQLDYHDLLKMMEEGQLDGIPYETVASKFRMIESVMMPIIIPYDQDAKDCLKGLRFADQCGGLARRLQSYMVQVPEPGYRALRNAGAIQPVAEKFGEQFMELKNPDLYDPRCGLSWMDSTYIKAERLVF